MSPQPTDDLPTSAHAEDTTSVGWWIGSSIRLAGREAIDRRRLKGENDG